MLRKPSQVELSCPRCSRGKSHSGRSTLVRFCLLLVLILGPLPSKADAQGSAPSGVGSESPFSVWLDPSDALQFSLRQLSSDLSSAASSAVRRFVPFLGPAQKTAYGQGTSSGQAQGTQQTITGTTPEKNQEILNWLKILDEMQNGGEKKSVSIMDLLEANRLAGNQLVIEDLNWGFGLFGPKSELQWDRLTNDYRLVVDDDVKTSMEIAVEFLNLLMQVTNKDRKVPEYLIQIDLTTDNSIDKETLDIYRNAVQARLGIAAGYAEMFAKIYLEGIVELTPTGPVLLVGSYISDANYRDALWTAIPLGMVSMQRLARLRRQGQSLEKIKDLLRRASNMDDIKALKQLRDELVEAGEDVWKLDTIYMNHLADSGLSEAEQASRMAKFTAKPAGKIGPIKRLPPPTVKLLQKDLEHIVLRHWPTSGARGAGKFAEGTTAQTLLDMIKKAVDKGVSRPNTLNRPGTIFEYDFGRKIGVSISGNPATRIRVVIRPNGTVLTAFPF